MDYNLITNIENCYVDIPSLLYYSHIPTTVLVVFFGIFVLIKSKGNKIPAIILFLISIVFLLWTTFDIVLWTTYNGSIMMFFWSIFNILYVLMFTLTLYFTYSILDDNSIFHGIKQYLLGLVLLPFILLLPTSTNLIHFDITSCEPVENILVWYQYLYGVAIVVWIAFILFLRFQRSKSEERGKIFFTGLGIFSFLLAFSWSEIAGSLTRNWEYTQYGLLGMPVLVAFLVYLIVRYNTFTTDIVAPVALVIGLWFLVGSLLFVDDIETVQLIVSATLILLIAFGLALIRSIRREIALREQVEELAGDLAKANVRLKELDKMKSEFVSIASHQLRSPLTSIRGYASMLAEGSYGKLAPKAQEVLDKIVDSSKFMALSIEDYLNVSRIEAGNMKYELSDFNLKELAEKVVDELRPVAMKKGLVMIFRSDCDASCSVHADIGKTRQVIMNLLDNSMKYTPKGTITVVSHDDPKKKKMYVTIQDTGVGMSKETQGEVFDKFVRAKNANSVNVTGTGLGLFVAKTMITQMNGRVWAESEGEGKGSTFHIELPLLPGKTGR